MTLKVNSKRILDIIASQSGVNQTQAYKQIHPTASDVTARNNASQLMQKPEAQIYLQKHVNKAKETMVALLDSEKDDIRLRASDSILDRELGRATTRVETTSKSLVISIDLSQATDSPETD
jgi:hypothetical protein